MNSESQSICQPVTRPLGLNNDPKNSGLKKSGLKPGLTMVEALGVMIIFGIIIAGVFNLFGMIRDATNLSDAKTSLTAMSTQIKGHYSGVQNYTGLTNALAVKAGLVPPKLLKGDGIMTPWGGAITLASTTNAMYTITWTGLSDKICTAMSTFQPNLWQGISINGKAASLTATVSDADALCSGNNNIIIYTDY